MTLPSEQPPNHRFPRHGVDPLPADRFEPELREVDALLRRAAERAAERVPAGLVDRVYAASAELLPTPRRVTAGPPRPRRGRHVSVRRQWIGRLAMAASLAFAFAVCSLFIRTPLSTEMTASVDGDGEIILASYSTVLSERPAEGELGHEMSYLLETGALESYDELTGEMEALIAELEM